MRRCRLLLPGAALAATAMVVIVGAAVAVDPPGAGRAAARDPQVGKSFRVPYRLTDTNHFLVRVRINGSDLEIKVDGPADPKELVAEAMRVAAQATRPESSGP